MTHKLARARAHTTSSLNQKVTHARTRARVHTRREFVELKGGPAAQRERVPSKHAHTPACTRTGTRVHKFARKHHIAPHHTTPHHTTPHHTTPHHTTPHHTTPGPRVTVAFRANGESLWQRLSDKNKRNDNDNDNGYGYGYGTGIDKAENNGTGKASTKVKGKGKEKAKSPNKVKSR